MADEHVDVVCRGEAALERLVDPLRVHALDDEHSGVGCHRTPAIPEDGDRLLVSPVVDHVLEQIGVATGRDLLEEVAADYTAAVRQASALDLLGGLLGHLWPV